MNIALLTLTVATFSSAALAAHADEPIKATYTCTGGVTLDVVFSDGKATVTSKGGEPVILPIAVTADGFQYSDAHHVLRGRGNEATWTAHHGKPLSCTAGDSERG